jgi:hypothetical protein
MAAALGDTAALIQCHGAGRRRRHANDHCSGNGENSVSHRILPIVKPNSGEIDEANARAALLFAAMTK